MIKMTLIVNIVTPEGIVMASDSRQSQKNNKQITRISTNNATKLFPINKRIMVGTAGLAFFSDKNGILKNVSNYIKEYSKSSGSENITVEEVAVQLQNYLSNKYPWQQQLDISVQQLKQDAKRNGAQILSIEKQNDSIEFKIKQPTGRIEEGHLNVEPVMLLVSGYNKNGSFETYEVHAPGNVERKRGNDEFGCTWIGQGDVVSRLILGYDGKLLGSPMFQKLFSSMSQEDILKQIRGVEYNISWGLLTLQDAVDLAVFLIKTTSTIQKFADGVTMDIGEVQGVGGPIDVAIITKERGVQWVNKKEITYNEL